MRDLVWKSNITLDFNYLELITQVSWIILAIDIQTRDAKMKVDLSYWFHFFSVKLGSLTAEMVTLVLSIPNMTGIYSSLLFH